MRIKFILSFCLVVLFAIPSTCQLTFGNEFNLDFYKPYSEFAKDYIKNNNVSSITNSSKLYCSFKIKNGQSLGFGFSYMFKNLKVENYYNGLSFTQHDTSGNPIDTTFYYSRFDLKVNSHSLGLYFDYSKLIISNLNSKGSIGLCLSSYLYEKAKGEYIDKDNLEESIQSEFYMYLPSVVGSIQNSRQSFFLSSVNLCIYYRQVFQLHEKFSLAARVSLGTNLYSDWDQFKKYAWLGLGLEMGFGKVKASKVNP